MQANYNVKNKTTIVTVLNVFKITQKDRVTKSALELMSYKLHTLVICVSSNFCALFYAKYLDISYVHMLIYISINTISCIFVFSLFDSLCPEAVPVGPGTRGKLMIFSKNKNSFHSYKCLFYRALYINFFQHANP